VYLALEASSPAATIVDNFLVVLILGNILAVILESVPSIQTAFAWEFHVFDVISVAVFTIEYIARLWAAIEIPAIRAAGPVRGRIHFALRPSMIIDFFAFAPSYLAFVLPGLDTRVL